MVPCDTVLHKVMKSDCRLHGHAIQLAASYKHICDKGSLKSVMDDFVRREGFRIYQDLLQSRCMVFHSRNLPSSLATVGVGGRR